MAAWLARTLACICSCSLGLYPSANRPSIHAKRDAITRLCSQQALRECIAYEGTGDHWIEQVRQGS